jgi:hypothetical protein
MPTILNISPLCILKEIELLQEEVQKNERTNPSLSDLRARQFVDTTAFLSIKQRCMCRDPTCSQWSGSYCHCNGNPHCKSLSFEFRYIEHVPDKSDISLAQAQIPASELERGTDEPYIVWKARTENRIWTLAMSIHDTPEDGITEYSYGWGGTSLRQFQAYIRDVRGLGTNAGITYTNACGCSACRKIFVSEATLITHVDTRRALNDITHLHAHVTTPTTDVEVRPTPSGFRAAPLNIQRQTINEDTSIPRDSVVVAEFERGITEMDDDWRERLREYIRSVRLDYPTAIACFRCGTAYIDTPNFYYHVLNRHDNSVTQTNALRYYGAY